MEKSVSKALIVYVKCGEECFQGAHCVFFLEKSVSKALIVYVKCGEECFQDVDCQE